MALHDLDDIVTSSEIAKMLGVSNPAVSNYKERHKDFPAPIKVAGKTSLYSRKEILEWARSRMSPEYKSFMKELLSDV